MDYTKYLNERANGLPPSGIRKFFDIVTARKDIISLGVGEPDFDTPWGSREAAVKCIRSGNTQYTSNFGLIELRELISKYYALRYNVTYEPKGEILVTTGASEAIDLAMRAICKEGDEVLIPEPSYVSYRPCVILNGGVPVAVKCEPERAFALTAENLEKVVTEKTKAIILPYPNNPTGAIMEKSDLEQVADFIKKHDLIVVSDEIYSELTYTETGHVSIASLKDMRERTIVINGFSKAFAMTGWRLGYALAPHGLIDVMYRIHQYTMLCAPTVSQYAGKESLRQSFTDNFQTVSEMREQYDVRRRYLVKRLNAMGLTCFNPRGAFYVFPRVSAFGLNGDEFAQRLLDEQSVAVVPGSSFGTSGLDYVRISYAYSLKDIETALDKIEKFLKTIKK